MTAVVVDTNVGIVANSRVTHADAACIAACATELAAIMRNCCVVIDDAWHVLNEYSKRLNSTGQPGAGDLFLRWILVNSRNPSRCSQVSITHTPAAQFMYAEIPKDPALAGFDRSDQKFLALAITHPGAPVVKNATDSDWATYHSVIASHGVTVQFLCPQHCCP